MKYITGIQALNIPCSLDTTGDWHRDGISWDPIAFADSESSVFGDYGIEGPKPVTVLNGRCYFVANHIRACLDMIASGQFEKAQCMRKDYIGNDIYDEEIFSQVLKLKNKENWPEIDRFMSEEYMMKWRRFADASR